LAGYLEKHLFFERYYFFNFQSFPQRFLGDEWLNYTNWQMATTNGCVNAHTYKTIKKVIRAFLAVTRAIIVSFV